MTEGDYFYILKWHTYVIRLEYAYLRGIYEVYVCRCIKRDKSSVKRDSGTARQRDECHKSGTSRLNRDG